VNRFPLESIKDRFTFFHIDISLYSVTTGIYPFQKGNTIRISHYWRKQQDFNQFHLSYYLLLSLFCQIVYLSLNKEAKAASTERDGYG